MSYASIREAMNVWRAILAIFFVMMFSLGTSFITIPTALNTAGFWLSLSAIVASWLYLLATSYYYLESALSMPPGANVYSISKKYNSIFALWFNTILFFVVNYGLMLVYYRLGIPILTETLNHYNISSPELYSYLFFAVILGCSVLLGVRWAMLLNLIITAILALFLYPLFGEALKTTPFAPGAEFKFDFLALFIPSLINSMYMQTIIPSLVSFLNKNVKMLKSVITIGLSLSFLLFITWYRLVVMTTGTTFEQLDDLYPSGLNFDVLHAVLRFGKWLPQIMLIAVTSSAIVTGVILVDFIADFFNVAVEKCNKNRTLIALVVMLPPLLAPLIHSDTVLTIFNVVADMGGIYLCGLLPIWWIWSLRYTYYENTPELLFGGKKLLIALTLISFFIFYLVGLEYIYSNYIYS